MCFKDFSWLVLFYGYCILSVYFSTWKNDVYSDVFSFCLISSYINLSFRKKKVTAEWRNAVRPMLWRCEWLELRMKDLLSQGSKYDSLLALTKQENELQRTICKNWFKEELQGFCCSSRHASVRTGITISYGLDQGIAPCWTFGVCILAKFYEFDFTQGTLYFEMHYY